MSKTPDPPVPFAPTAEILETGTVVHRCHQMTFRPGEANPGPRGAGRFHFFGSPSVPALYFAKTPETALCEKILRYTPDGDAPTRLIPSEYRNDAVSTLTVGRDLNIAMFHSQGLRALNIQASQLTDTGQDNYPQTRKWAEAAYDAGFDGISWMSHQLNGYGSWMVFGDRVTESDFTAGTVMPLLSAEGFSWLVDVCAPMNVEVLPPMPL